MFDSAETSGKKAPSHPPRSAFICLGGPGRNMKSAPLLFPVYLLIITLEIRSAARCPGRCRAGAALPGPGEPPGDPPAPPAQGRAPAAARRKRGTGSQPRPSGAAAQALRPRPLPEDRSPAGAGVGAGGGGRRAPPQRTPRGGCCGRPWSPGTLAH